MYAWIGCRYNYIYRHTEQVFSIIIILLFSLRLCKPCYWQIVCVSTIHKMRISDTARSINVPWSFKTFLNYSNKCTTLFTWYIVIIWQIDTFSLNFSHVLVDTVASVNHILPTPELSFTLWLLKLSAVFLAILFSGDNLVIFIQIHIHWIPPATKAVLYLYMNELKN